MPADPAREIGRHEGGVSALALTAEGHVVSGGREDGVVRMWNPAMPDDSGRVLGRLDSRELALASTADGRVDSCGSDGVRRTRPLTTTPVWNSAAITVA